MNTLETEPAFAEQTVGSISAADPDWREQCERLAGQHFEISHVRRPDEILFIADFAARHQLALICKNGVFELKPQLRGAAMP